MRIGHNFQLHNKMEVWHLALYGKMNIVLFFNTILVWEKSHIPGGIYH